MNVKCKLIQNMTKRCNVISQIRSANNIFNYTFYTCTDQHQLISCIRSVKFSV